ncbi:MAG: UDP-N-acetylmuramoyl-tripeptide--D-alanyl-D-alanine ligase [Betaproteobacteria bacterium AqS2]|uniref:UDP-N-acetylmuramoyl-tripeptide--D-alanyl-D-alanine ligase n=1 Tax=Candidatus Amphirhobacter heronislandensis TaxID=1732024 RepID=A0A930Y1D6_9GAMM|nr:UDP-N-acetylmuramoyl-tripeptide--D-alanyl-D-alanine ligase [Betaproteobacteria bacterium AqS2]
MAENATGLTPATAQLISEGVWKNGEPAEFGRLCFDSRRLRPGETFIALKGGRDGHDFVAAAAEQGAAAAIVSKEVPCELPQLLVTDTMTALSDLAHWWRAAFHHGALAMVTGSNGKSTTKEMLAGILAEFAGADRVHATSGNHNNMIGLPLTLLDLRPRHSLAVVEAGMNAAGEIARLARLARPSLGVITNAGRAHLGNFSCEEDIARAKGELLTSMPRGAVAVLNADDRFYPLWREMAAHLNVISFSHAGAASADVRRVPDRDFVYAAGAEQHEASLQVAGAHNEMNALAAAAAALRMGAPHECIRRGLENFAGVPGRQEVIVTDRFVLINDAYNASPESFEAAIDSLRARPERRKIIAMGDMLELGEAGAQLHRDVISYAQQAGIDDILACGPLASAAAAAAGARGCPDREALTAELRAALPPSGCAILVKGSHGMRMDEVVAALLENRP